ncbi:tRNAHis guanylyltransferase Thg1 [Fadolivirus algeromassiliense]|jgi:tRNA(His) 5'-end guanylyltransferase|uniref:tRNAHis guanylyltransferase Thg1 n=1 Tax=Fadolivirus FV1/VV64 TaxID=3070911 RepID=A0A7D3QTW0_9VIRU|nr:tRNAHis guanylyltransferase Thg1 [Fadolivirus algeromassiliense]QKF93647.1 tRNAHis guanylyltransferase Thg1 [Fadolivirus FV1/VV64]
MLHNELEDMDIQHLDERMKKYEEPFNYKILPYMPFVVRLDGRAFSKYTIGFKKPFDNLFQCAMINTMNDLVTEFSVRTGYTHSDEITLVFPEVCTEDEYNNNTNKATHIYDGRILKICTVLAGYCSSKFNYHINRLFDFDFNRKHYQSTLANKIKSCDACFDCRIIQFPVEKTYEIVNLLIWRSVRDSHRNAVEAYARKYFSHSQLHGKNTGEMIQMMKEEMNMDWNTDVPIYHKHGVYAKRELYKKEIEYKGVVQEVLRQRICNKSFIINYSQNMYDLLMMKDWPADLSVYNTTFTDISFTTDGCIVMS